MNQGYICPPQKNRTPSTRISTYVPGISRLPRYVYVDTYVPGLHPQKRAGGLLMKLLLKNKIKSSTEIQSSAIIVHEEKRTATSTRTTQTRQDNPYRLGAAPAGVVGARSRCCPAATVPAAVVFACQETYGPHGRAYQV